jgi:3-dehydroquinate synthase
VSGWDRLSEQYGANVSKTVTVRLGERSYPIAIGGDLPPASVLPPGQATGVMIVSDSHVDPLYGALRQAAFARMGCRVVRATVPAGESSKDWKWAAELWSLAAQAGLDRTSVIVALGGGMVGDLAGFVAATYLRGVRLIQMPTSLLAMVDSSVGGKTAINLPQGKNLVGAFYQPVEVVADLNTLGTLPEREYRSGLAEVVKYGVIWDAAFFRCLEEQAEALLARRANVLERVVARCCEIKAEVVAIDERESGPRAVLNFGHTLAHALETAAGYGRWLHGEAVAIGMAFAAQLSVATHGMPAAEAARMTGLLKRLGLPVGPGEGGAPWPALREAMRADKKTVQGSLRFVLARRLGAVVHGCEVSDDQLAETWNVCSQ